MENIGQLLQSPDPLALYQALQERDNQARKTQNYQQLAQSNLGAAGWAGVAGNLIGGLLGRKNQKKLDESNRGYLQQEGVYNKELAAFQAQQKKMKAEQQRALKLEDEQRKQGYALELAEAKKTKTTMVRNLIAQGLQPGTPEFQKAIQVQMNKSNAPVVNVNNGKTQGVFEEALARGNAKKFNEWESKALASNEMLSKLGQIEQISQAQKTGKVNEALAMAGQWFGTAAGANLQSFNAIQKDLMLDAASNLKGAMSDGEWRVLQAKMPDFGDDQRANEKKLSILKGAAQRNINRYENASRYISKNGKMQGFKPEFYFSEKNKQAPKQSQQQNQQKSKAIGGKQYVQIDGQWYEQ